LVPFPTLIRRERREGRHVDQAAQSEAVPREAVKAARATRAPMSHAAAALAGDACGVALSARRPRGARCHRRARARGRRL